VIPRVIPFGLASGMAEYLSRRNRRPVPPQRGMRRKGAGNKKRGGNGYYRGLQQPCLGYAQSVLSAAMV